jgi:hypothetical protein
MSDEECEGFLPRCAICGSVVPRERATRRYETCCPEHAAKLKDWRRWLHAQRKCIACLRPSSPKEREDYRAWRKHRGDIGEKPGRKKGSRQEPTLPAGYSPEANVEIALPVDTEHKDCATL